MKARVIARQASAHGTYPGLMPRIGASAAEEMASTTEELTGQSEQLVGALGFFQTKGDGARAVKAVAAAREPAAQAEAEPVAVENGDSKGLRAKVMKKAGVKLRLNEKRDAMDEEFERY
jgi:methyl-accepting chemotaxis protein